MGPDFVWRMDDLLDLYAKRDDPYRPVVCFDQTSKQLITETRLPLPMEPCMPERVDYEYERKRTANLFLVTEPLSRCATSWTGTSWMPTASSSSWTT